MTEYKDLKNNTYHVTQSIRFTNISIAREQKSSAMFPNLTTGEGFSCMANQNTNQCQRIGRI